MSQSIYASFQHKQLPGPFPLIIWDFWINLFASFHTTILNWLGRQRKKWDATENLSLKTDKAVVVSVIMSSYSSYLELSRKNTGLWYFCNKCCIFYVTSIHIQTTFMICKIRLCYDAISHNHVQDTNCLPRWYFSFPLPPLPNLDEQAHYSLRLQPFPACITPRAAPPKGSSGWDQVREHRTALSYSQ